MLIFGHMSKNSILSKIQRENNQRLIDAAFVVFTRDGYEKASIRSIAKQADMTSGLVYYYFKTKDQILIAVQKYVQERYHEQYKSPAQPVTVQDQLNEIRSRVIDNPDWYRWRYELYALGLKRQDLKEEVAAVLRSGRESIIESLYSDITPDTNSAAAIAALLIACFDGLALQKLIDPQFNLDAAYDELLAVLEQYFLNHTKKPKI
ncbi:MAG: TetR/AcrR family transcriptional regulator [Chitinophagaceae bacterium]|nr:MAG: TetR/AcrR family transcriptional regulator [Chitinophagaceae bacterium]